jgi:hypothetical protein
MERAFLLTQRGSTVRGKVNRLKRIYETVGCVQGFVCTRRRALGKRAPFRSRGKAFAIVNPKARY